MKISTQNGVDVLTLKIEGRVVGDWASELGQFWTMLMPSLNTKKLCIDIRGVLYLDGKGKEILQEIVEATGAEVLADSPLTKQFADEIGRKAAEKRRRGEVRCKAYMG